MYNFNASFDAHVFLPAVHAYQAITPDFVEQGVTNFYNNFDDTRTLLNALLQLKFKATFDSFFRVTYNSIFGIAGIIDVATYIGIPRHQEDFGQVLGHYGVGPGPYLVIPIVGPANLRDAAGRVADVFPAATLDPFDLRGHRYRTWTFNIFRAVDLRANTAFRYYQTGSPFKYELVRMLYSTKRKMDIAK